ncbi:hypothetical protein KVR01_008563 [Diaporthe batatas]|uniref:uncharacterized protein n=1 Tax=Diaporthe batatas TaxID=748121 RepID=UPI001D04287C|nr:uncharacterized protein KVR01_008563 [Diaporthe batatas]KAG8161576.1 hypothetical protein KVR01_008563 [Diaporthe batatas]
MTTSVSPDLIQTAMTWRNTLYTACQGWTEVDTRVGKLGVTTPKNYFRPIWHHSDRLGDVWDPVRTTVQDPDFEEASEVWLCSEFKAPPIKPIQVDAILEAFKDGPPQEWRGPRTADERKPGPRFAGTGHPPVTELPASTGGGAASTGGGAASTGGGAASTGGGASSASGSGDGWNTVVARGNRGARGGRGGAWGTG